MDTTYLVVRLKYKNILYVIDILYVMHAASVLKRIFLHIDRKIKTRAMRGPFNAWDGLTGRIIIMIVYRHCVHEYVYILYTSSDCRNNTF